MSSSTNLRPKPSMLAAIDRFVSCIVYSVRGWAINFNVHLYIYICIYIIAYCVYVYIYIYVCVYYYTSYFVICEIMLVPVLHPIAARSTGSFSIC